MGAARGAFGEAMAGDAKLFAHKFDTYTQILGQLANLVNSGADLRSLSLSEARARPNPLR